MVQFEEQKFRLEEHDAEIKDLKDAVKYDDMTSEINELNELTMQEGFWEDLERSQKVNKRLSSLKSRVEAYDKLVEDYNGTLELIEMADTEEELSMLDEISSSIDQIIKSLEEMKLSTLLTGEYDSKNAILTFHAGAGGTEAQDWAEMLFRMYNHWAERHNFKCKTIDFLDGDEAGLKSAVLLIEGENAYGFLKSENGVHRLVRISPFDSSGRRHTSFASLEVMPEIDDTIEVEIKEDDLKVDTYRSSGAGGQHINKTSSAVRITHIPSGIVVACQNERSQHQNKDMAMKMLKSKLIEIKEREHLEKVEDIKGVKNEIAWGSQIRSYVFMPYTLVKDHRTGFENGNINAVMNGDLDGFINAYLKSLVTQ